MLSGVFVSAESAETYHLRDDYYLESEGFWHGKLADKLKLTGKLEADEFKDVLRGYLPGSYSKVKLVVNAGQEDRRAGCDLTFSAPKSVSVLAYIDSRIQTAFYNALLLTLDYAEREFMLTRRKRKGIIQYEKTDNAIFAIFGHKTSRELDPQLHAHCVLQNITAGNDGRCRAMHNIIFWNKKLIGQYFRNVLALELKKLGYGIEITDRKEGFFEISGIAKEIVKKFSKRRKQVEKGVKELQKLRYCDLENHQIKKWAIERVGGSDPQRLKDEMERMRQSKELVYPFDPKLYPNKKSYESKLAEIAARNTRESKVDVFERIPSDQKNDTEKYIINQINGDLKSFGVTLDSLQQQAMNATPPKLNTQTPTEAIEEVIHELTQKEVAFTKEEVLRSALPLTMGNYTPDEVVSAYNKLIESGKLCLLRVVTMPQKGQINIYSTPELRNIEMENIDICRKSKTNIAIDPQIVDRYINAKHQELLDQSGGQIGFAVGQKAAFRQMATTKFQFSVIQGDAGTGKSFVMRYAKEFLESHGYSVRGLAPTGKATDELRDAAELENSDTIHKFIYKFLNSPEELDIKRGKEVIIVDESSMSGSVTINQILKRAKEYDVKVVFVGDRKQFMPVGAGKFFNDLQDKTNVDMTEMKEVIRQKTPQTKNIVKAISDKNIAGAFNNLTGYAAIEFDKAIIKNYKIGQILTFTDHTADIPAGTNAKITKIEHGELIINYNKNGKEIEYKFNPKRAKRAFSVYGEAKDYKNSVNTIVDKDARLQAVANDYVNCYNNGTAALVITATNDDRRHLNATIRKTLVAQKKVEDINEFTLLEPHNISSFNFADAFSVGQLVKGLPQLKVKNKYEYGQIVNIDKNQNRLIIRSKTGEDYSVDPSKYAHKPFSVFDETSTTLGINEKVTFLKNALITDKITGKKVSVRNGQIVTITALDKDGNATIKTSRGKDINFNIKDYNLLTTAYALSAHKSQGMTVDKIIWHADTAKDVSMNSFYVAVTRCKYDVSIYTDNVESLQQKASKEQSKYSTIDDDVDDDIEDDINDLYTMAYEKRMETIQTEKAAKLDKIVELVKEPVAPKAEEPAASIVNSTELGMPLKPDVAAPVEPVPETQPETVTSSVTTIPSPIPQSASAELPLETRSEPMLEIPLEPDVAAPVEPVPETQPDIVTSSVTAILSPIPPSASAEPSRKTRSEPMLEIPPEPDAVAPVESVLETLPQIDTSTVTAIPLPIPLSASAEPSRKTRSEPMLEIPPELDAVAPVELVPETRPEIVTSTVTAIPSPIPLSVSAEPPLETRSEPMLEIPPEPDAATTVEPVPETSTRRPEKSMPVPAIETPAITSTPVMPSAERSPTPSTNYYPDPKTNPYQQQPGFIEKTFDKISKIISDHKQKKAAKQEAEARMEAERQEQERQRLEQERLRQKQQERDLKMNKLLEDINKNTEISVASATETLNLFHDETEDTSLKISDEFVKKFIPNNITTEKNINKILLSTKENLDSRTICWKKYNGNGTQPIAEIRGRSTPDSTNPNDLLGLIIKVNEGESVHYIANFCHKNNFNKLLTVCNDKKPCKFNSLDDAQMEIEIKILRNVVEPQINEILDNIVKQNSAKLKQQRIAEIESICGGKPTNNKKLESSVNDAISAGVSRAEIINCAKAVTFEYGFYDPITRDINEQRTGHNNDSNKGVVITEYRRNRNQRIPEDYRIEQVKHGGKNIYNCYQRKDGGIGLPMYDERIPDLQNFTGDIKDYIKLVKTYVSTNKFIVEIDKLTEYAVDKQKQLANNKNQSWGYV